MDNALNVCPHRNLSVNHQLFNCLWIYQEMSEAGTTVWLMKRIKKDRLPSLET